MKELKFIHITKCAGTTIENIGKKNNILWGRFHKEYGWHHEIFPNKIPKLKLKYDWFVVVRNPYERLISEFYCKWGGVGKIDNIDDIDEKIITSMLDTSSQKDPDLIIRTAGEQRLSNFLSWQSAYSEFYFSGLEWPEFNKTEFFKALESYKSRVRSFGAVVGE